MKPEGINAFIKSFHINGTVTQITDYNNIYYTGDDPANFILSNPDKHLFFCSNIEDSSKAHRKGGRFTSDADVKTKKYIGFDFDVRKDFHPEYSDDEIKEWGIELMEELNSSEMFKDWSYVNFTGNGIHIFYIGDAVSLDNETYKTGVSYLQKELENLTDFKPDSTCKNLSRIFRVPGSFNKKNNPPNQVEILVAKPRYSKLLSKLEEFSKEIPKQEEYIRPPAKNGYDSIFEWIEQQDQQWCLQKVSGSTPFGGETYDFKKRDKGGYTILVNGKKCQGWIESDGLIHGKGRNTIIYWRKKCDNAPHYEKGELAIELEKLFPEFKSTFKPSVPFLSPSKRIAPASELQIPPSVTPKVSLVDIKDMMAEAWDEVDNFDPSSVVSYGYNFLDDQLGGIMPGDLVLVGGITGTGKTTLSIRIAEKAARAGKKVIIATLEDRLITRAKRMVVYEINRMRHQTPKNFIRLKDFLIGKVKVDKAEWDEAVSRLPNVTYVKTSGKLTPEDLSVIYAEKADLYVIDHLHYFSLHNKNISKADSIESAMQTINDMTKQRDTRTILVAHFLKLDETKRPTQTDFKDSMSIAQTADTVILLWRDKRFNSDESDDKNRNRQYLTEFIIPKNRIDEPSLVIEAKFDQCINDYANYIGVKHGTQNSSIPRQVSSGI